MLFHKFTTKIFTKVQAVCARTWQKTNKQTARTHSLQRKQCSQLLCSAAHSANLNCSKDPCLVCRRFGKINRVNTGHFTCADWLTNFCSATMTRVLRHQVANYLVPLYCTMYKEQQQNTESNSIEKKKKAKIAIKLSQTSWHYSYIARAIVKNACPLIHVRRKQACTALWTEIAVLSKVVSSLGKHCEKP